MKRFAVIGLGKFGFQVAKSLYEDGNEVIAIDSERTRIQLIDPYSSEAVVLDATDKEKLRSLGLETTDGVVVSTGERISTSILISLYLQEMGVKNILVKALDDDHGKILKRVGATQIIHPEKEMAVKVARGLSTPNILDFIPLEQDFNLVQVAPPKAFVGKSLRQLDLRAKYKVHVIAIKEKDPPNLQLVPSADAVIREDDTLLVLGNIKHIRRIRSLE
ncbi:MAG: TrkA family potassium uptake protein [Thermodesulfobacteriota bacterium]|nr:TrkA family potassium uptake protein [Thermodesulfobacteriota bacterium]